MMPNGSYIAQYILGTIITLPVTKASHHKMLSTGMHSSKYSEELTSYVTFLQAVCGLALVRDKECGVKRIFFKYLVGVKTFIWVDQSFT